MSKNYLAFIACPTSGHISVWTFDHNGGLHYLYSLRKYCERAQPMTWDEKSRILYVGARPWNKIIAYEIGKYGFISKSYEVLTLNNTPTYISLDEKNNLILCASYQGDFISAKSLDKAKKNILLSGKEIRLNLKAPHCILKDKYDSMGNSYIVPCLKQDCISVFGLVSGKLALMYTIENPSGMGPRHIAFNETLPIFYCSNEYDGSVSIYKKIGRNYRLIKTCSAFYKANGLEFWTADIHVFDKYLYISDRNLHRIAHFMILSDGDLKLIGYTDVEKQPRGFSIDPKGNYLICLGQASNDVGVYKIDKNDGSLDLLRRYSLYEGAKGPMWVNIVPM